ncbi:putative s-adenosyl-l-methionine-dependent methyltransferase protein [Phaeoacremonium minimum UCRPA7]|uniref:Putative s-adenosyl-l-methionine-dependent methyltransferase protein n=1 Tax=Phaeoacremonium minimum (strain UCR-PA7) TaxID=1286976 RepID=R8BQG5_PHAM7|nr:putative s-adenosyl-l-methionine-dependent methyltransferase protein [Phaeoacremonium minimum UCRPA7]EOO01623.1 putative s-adenosyl-l-methionine-dependent methyltransferase protein [Phaeoacremonium minimum UCRPA7]
MGKFKWASWKRPSSDSPDTERVAEAKKQGRRPFSMSMASPVKNKEEAVDGETRQSASTSEVSESVPTQSTSEMVKLARKIVAEAEKLEKYMKDNNIPEPSFDVNAPSDFPKLPADVHVSRQEIIHATGQLRELAVGPRESVRWGIWGFLDVLAIQVVNSYGIAKLVPIDGTITLSELQSKSSLDPVNLARVIRMTMTNGIFCEPSPGVIAHTAASRVLAEDPNLQGWVGFNTEDIFPAAAHVLQALKKYPEATDLKQAGFQFAFDTVDKEPMFVTFGKDPVRAKRMGLAMTSLTGGEGYEVSYLTDVEGGGYDFTAIDEAGGTFVDVGGSVGFVCVDLAKKYKNMKFVVQDLPKTIDSISKPIHEDSQIAERIELQAYDFFTPQVVKGADVYFFRWIIHNYSTPFAIKILKNLIPALKPGARIIINDHCLREPGAENPWDEKLIRRMDMVMLALLNAQERTEAEYRELFKAASDGFVFKGVMRPKGCRMSIVEAVWEGQSE